MQVYYYRPGDPCHVIVIQVIDGPFILLDTHGSQEHAYFTCLLQHGIQIWLSGVFGEWAY